MKTHQIINGKKVRVPHYHRWLSMKQRCYNPNAKKYPNYGARGIVVCEQWFCFETFYKWCEKGYKPGLSIDRIDNDGPYAPWNCKWSTNSEQILNARNHTPKKLALYKKWFTASKLNFHSKFGDPKTRTEKICGTCKKKFPLDLFYKHSKAPDGRQGTCKKCSKISLTVESRKVARKNAAHP